MSLRKSLEANRAFGSVTKFFTLRSPLFNQKIAGIFGLFLVAPHLTVSLSAQAVPLVIEVDEPVPTGVDFFASQPALLPLGKVGVAAELHHSLSKQKLQEVSATQDRTAQATERHLRQTAGFALPLGDSLGIAVLGHQDEEEVLAKRTDSRYDDSPMQESSTHRGIRSKFALDFSKTFRVGAGFRMEWTKRTVLGSFDLPAEETSSLKGSRVGAEGGIQTKFSEGGFGLSYFTALKGKVESSGENLVSSSPGLVQATGYWNASNQFAMGLSYGKYLYEEDELLEPTTGPNRQNRNTISLLGLAPESKYAKTQMVIANLIWKLSTSVGLKLAPLYETGEYDIESKVGESSNAKRTKGFVGGDFSLAVADQHFELLARHRYLPRKHSYEVSNDGAKRNFDSSTQATTVSFVFLF